MTLRHVFTNAIADGTNTSIVRPSDWNSAHMQVVTLDGNTAGVSTVSGTNIVFGGSNNVTLSGIQGANVATINISAAAGGGGGSLNISAGTTSNNLTNLVLSDGSGVTFGLNGSTVTAAVATTYRASNDAVGLNTAQTNVTWTVNSAGLSLNAAGYAGTGFTSTTTAGVDVKATQATNGLSMAVPAYITTWTVPTVTNSSWTVSDNASSATVGRLAFTNLNGVTLSLSTGTAGSHTIVGSHNGLTSQSNQNVTAANGGFAFQTLSFSNLNGISFGTSAGSAITASHNALTTARASTDAIGLNTAQSNVTWTVNSSGLSLDARGYAGTGTTFNGANLSGSMTVNSNGVQLSMSAAAPGGGGLTQGTFFAQSNTTQSSSGTIALSSLNFAGAGIASVGVSNGSVVISVPSGGGAGDGGAFLAAGTRTAGSNSTVLFSNANGVSFGLDAVNGSVMTASVDAGGAAGTIGGWEPIQANNNTTFSSQGQNSIYLQKMIPDENYSFNNIEFRVSGSFVSSSNSQVVAYSIRYGLYSLETNDSYISLATSLVAITARYNSNTSMGYTISQGAASFTTSSGGTAIASLMSGFKHLYLPFTSTITAGGRYAVALNISSATTTNTGPMRLAFLNQTVINNLTVGKIYATTILASNASFVGDYDQAVYSATSGALPASIAVSRLTKAVSQARLYVQFEV